MVFLRMDVPGAGRLGCVDASRSQDLPIAVVIVDTAEKIEAFLPQLDELVTEGLVLLDEVHVHRYRTEPAAVTRF